MAPRIKSVKTKESLNVSQGYSTSPAREVPDLQGGNTQAAAGALVGATETQVVPDSYEHAAYPLGAQIQQPAEDFDELYDATPRKSSQKVPLKPAHLPQIEHEPLQLVAGSALALTQSQVIQEHVPTATQQLRYTSSGTSKSSNCFTIAGSATSDTEAMTSAAKPGKLSAVRLQPRGAHAKLLAARGQAPEADDAGASVSPDVKKRSADTQMAGLMRAQKPDVSKTAAATKKTTAQTRTQKPDVSKIAAATKRAKAPPAGNPDRPARGQKRTRAAPSSESDYKPSQPARKKVTQASKIAVESHEEEEEEPDSSQPPTKRRRVNAPKSPQPASTQVDLHVTSDGDTSSPMPDDDLEDDQAQEFQKATSKAAPPRTPAQVKSSPPRALREQVDDTVLFEQAARSSKKPNLVGWGKTGPRNQGVLSASTPGPHDARSAVELVSTNTRVEPKLNVTNFSARQGATEGSHQPKASNVAENVSQAMDELYRKPEVARDDHESPYIDNQDDLMATKKLPPHTMVTPAAQEQPSVCAQPPPMREATKPGRYITQSMQTVDKAGSPIPPGMGIEDSTRTVLEMFSQQEARDPPERDTFTLHVHQPKQDRVMSSNAKAVPASPSADSTALTTMRATKSQSKKMLAKDDRASTVDDPFLGNEAAAPARPKSDALTKAVNEPVTWDRELEYVSHSTALSSKPSGVKGIGAKTQTARQKPVPRAATPPLAVAKTIGKKLPAIIAPIMPAISSPGPDSRPAARTALKTRPQTKTAKSEPRVHQRLSSESPHEQVFEIDTTRRSSVTPIMDEEEDDPEKTLVDSDSVEIDLNQWTATLKPHQLSLFGSMVDCVQRLTEYMFDQEQGSEQMVQEHHRRTMFLIEQEEMHRVKDHARLRRIVRARKQERIADAQNYHHELLTQAAEFEREKKQLRKRIAAWDAASQDLEGFIVQYS